MGINYEIESELESFVKVDESVCKTLEKRDDKYSPIRSNILSKSMMYEDPKS